MREDEIKKVLHETVFFYCNSAVRMSNRKHNNNAISLQKKPYNKNIEGYAFIPKNFCSHIKVTTTGFKNETIVYFECNFHVES